MHKIVMTTALVLASQFALGADPTPQQQRMKDCNAEAKEKALAGQPRKDFMKACLGGKQADAKAARSTQQEKMKACNADAGAKGLKGPERKAFMSDCLKN